jgi:hypothetical protein
MKIYTHDHIPLGELSEGDMEAFRCNVNATLDNPRIWLAQAMNYFEVFVALVAHFLKLVPVVWFWLLVGLFLLHEGGALPPPPLDWHLNPREHVIVLTVKLACLVAMLLIAASMSATRLRALGLRNIREEVLIAKIRTFSKNEVPV